MGCLAETVIQRIQPFGNVVIRLFGIPLLDIHQLDELFFGNCFFFHRFGKALS
ncbi:Uncharacterised protein [Vibrio cholerae]|uniref:Uncharacterized protein n=1 Tax=Vibrio cholerae TaxID=666 RepID=A0A655PEA2_VIBCL|nr:Uncharacterised protein [Vibrio cholerae]CSA88363.1 Uncharacterised protein [Vibrio cholerae]CSB19110.1 Uncharacterised protein [Vibrio cholerae]CSB19671.1 Uncharacterised protein [Vibrio cholerae]CSB25501.1 Uncharacterised protein [Vibrio cholerae]